MCKQHTQNQYRIGVPRRGVGSILFALSLFIDDECHVSRGKKQLWRNVGIVIEKPSA